MKALLLGLGFGLLWTGPAVWGAVYEEDWDTSGLANHHWKYWGEAETDREMTWQANGGNPDGYVVTSLSETAVWSTGGTYYWPAYTVENDREVSQHLSLSPVSQISLDLNGYGNFNLQGGGVYFFIGEWNSASDMVFFYRQSNLTPGAETWQANSLTVGGDSDWGTLMRIGNSKNPSDLYDNPQQYGLVIVDASSQPTGSLGMDNFVAVPEPRQSGLFALGAALLFWGWHRRYARV